MITQKKYNIDGRKKKNKKRQKKKRTGPKQKKSKKKKKKSQPKIGIEPTTFCLRSKCSAAKLLWPVGFTMVAHGLQLSQWSGVIEKMGRITPGSD
jgi:hypothetical protein